MVSIHCLGGNEEMSGLFPLHYLIIQEKMFWTHIFWQVSFHIETLTLQLKLEDPQLFKLF